MPDDPIVPASPPADDSPAPSPAPEDTTELMTFDACNAATVVADDAVLEMGHAVPASPRTEHAEKAATVIGRYRLLRELGRGGFGMVWQAEQTEPIRREVALKIIKPGMDSEEIISRFEAERQALALMDHPNIASVLDAGTTESHRPYFVMELVKGAPITEYCDAHQLTIRQRLQLFIPVCQAVQHAHQKGILHRDLKPSNILVTEVDGKPVPKVIDFGIAKALGATQDEFLRASLALTQAGAVIGTPQYMSPEQAGACPDLDTRSDIYTLGVILYEMLTGRTPLRHDQIRQAALDEVLRLIREHEALRPSSCVTPVTEATTALAAQRQTDAQRLGRTLRGDLDWIVLKSVEKDRDRRNHSVNGLAEDIIRHLNDEPVSASPPSSSYRLRKLVRKHRVVFAAMTSVVAALAVGAGVASWRYLEEIKARKAVGKLAEAHAAQVEAQAAQLRRISRADYATGVDLIRSGERRKAVAYFGRALRNWSANGPAAFAYWDAVVNADRDHSPLPYASTVDQRTPIGSVHCAASSPDGERFLTGSRSGTVTVWDALTGEVSLTFQAHPEPDSNSSGGVYAVAFSPDGRRILTGGFDNSAKLWDAQTGRELHIMQGHSKPVTKVAFFPDGLRLVTGSEDGSVRTWDGASGQLLHTLQAHSAYIGGLAISPSGVHVLTGARDGTAKVWNASGGEEILTLRGHNDPFINAVAFSPDGSRLLTGGRDGTVRVWDARTGSQLMSLPLPNGAISVGFSQDGAQVLAYGHEGARVWSVSDGTLLLSTQRGKTGSWTGAFSPDGSRILESVSRNSIRLWRGRIRNDLPTVRGLSFVSVAVSPDGAHLLTGNRDGAMTWDLKNGTNQVKVDGHTISVAYSPDGASFLALGRDRSLKVLDARSGELRFALKPPSIILSAAYTADGRWILTCTRNGSVSRWDARTGELAHSVEGNPLIQTGAFSPDGSKFAAGIRSRPGMADDPGGIVTVRESQTGKELWKKRGFYISDFFNIAFSPDGTHVLAADRDFAPVLLNADTGKEVFRVKGHDKYVKAVAFSPDGTHLVTTGYEGVDDGTIKIWDAQSGTLVGEWVRHSEVVANVAFAPAPNRLATASADGTVRIGDYARNLESVPVDLLERLTAISAGYEFSDEGKLQEVPLERRMEIAKSLPRSTGKDPYGWDRILQVLEQ